MNGKVGDIGNKLPLFGKMEAMIDVETTSAQKNATGLIQIGASVYDPSNPSERLSSFSTYVRPDPAEWFQRGTNIEELRERGLLVAWNSMSAGQQEDLRGYLVAGAEENMKIHNIGYAKVEGAPTKQEATSALYKHLKENNVGRLSAFNSSFDQAVLQKHGLNLHFEEDLMPITHDLLGITGQEGIKGFGGVENIARMLGVLGQDQKEAHDALSDANLQIDIKVAARDPERVAAARAIVAEVNKSKPVSYASKNIGIEPGMRSIFGEARDRFANQFPNLEGVFETGLKYAKKNPLMAATAGLGAFYMGMSLAKPLALIPGGDDDYNTIEGMAHGGYAQQLRDINTDFGSGYQGDKSATVDDFRRKWYQTSESQAALQEEIAKSQVEYSTFLAGEMMRGPNGLQRVDLSQFNTRWDDADTLLLRRKGVYNYLFGDDIAVRLTGIDAPEMEHPDDPTAWFRNKQEQPYARQSKAIAEELSAGKDLTLVMNSTDKTFGRYVGLVYGAGEDVSINEQLIGTGAAAYLPFGDEEDEIYNRKEFSATEAEAMEAKKGMWNEPFFQAFAEMGDAAGQRTTLNSFTDLTKMARNQNLVNAQEFLFNAQENGEYDSSVAQRIGKSLKRPQKYKSNRISGKDDDYNTIEGLGHEGIAWKIRQAMTDFGSGFKEGSKVGKKIIKKMMGSVEEVLEKSKVNIDVFDEDAAAKAFDLHVKQEWETTRIQFLSEFKEYKEARYGKSRAMPELSDPYTKAERDRKMKALLNDQLKREKREKAAALKKSHPNRVQSNITNTIDMDDYGSPGVLQDIVEGGHREGSEFGSPWKGLGNVISNQSANSSRKAGMAAAQKVTSQKSFTLGLLGGKGHTRYTNKS